MYRKTAYLALCFALSSVGASTAQEPHRHTVPEKLGAVAFPTTCAPSVQKRFERAVALLHSFAYTAAEAAFKKVAAADARCAMAHWGAAMTHFHALWAPVIPPGEFTRGQEEIRAARHVGTRSDRERQFINALSLIYTMAPYPERIARYERAMAGLARTHPEEAEAQIFYALALLASASPADKTHAKQKRAAQILDALYQRYPQHPGIAHYLIHAYDSSELAGRGIIFARAYSKIAPSAPHALHMPSHIFTRLGMWNDSIASNRAAMAAAHAHGDTGEELHAMDYLVYAYLQLGRETESNELIQKLNRMKGLNPQDFKVAYASAAMPVRHAVERRQWLEAQHLVPLHGAAPQVVAVTVWARALGFAKSGHPAEARGEAEKLHALERQLRASREQYWAAQVAIQTEEALGWIAQAEANATEARTLLRNAAYKEDLIEKLPVTPGPIIPAREQLGDLLLEQGESALAAKEFRTALASAPNRRGALNGLLRAQELAASRTQQ